MYPLVNALKRKSDETADAIKLLAASNAIDRETYSNLSITVVSLTTKLSSANKNLMINLKDNTHIKRLLGQCCIDGHTSKKIVTGGSLLSTHYCWSRGYDTGNPSFKCKDTNISHVNNETEADTRGG